MEILCSRYGKTTGLEGDLDTEGERLIGEWAQQELGSDLLFVTGYHVDNRPVYAMPDAVNPPLTHSFDLLFRGVEITTGGQRIHEYPQLVESIRARGWTRRTTAAIWRRSGTACRRTAGWAWVSSDCSSRCSASTTSKRRHCFRATGIG